MGWVHKDWSQKHSQARACNGMRLPNKVKNGLEFRFDGAQWICLAHQSIFITTIGTEWGVNWAGCGTTNASESLLYGRAIIAAAELASDLNNA